MSPTSAAPAVTPAGPPVAAGPHRPQTQARGGEKFDRELASAHETARGRDDVASKPADETTTAESHPDTAPGADANPVTQPAAPQSPTTDAATAAPVGAPDVAAAAALASSVTVSATVPVVAAVPVANAGAATAVVGAAAATSVPATAAVTATATGPAGSAVAASGVTAARPQTGDGEDAGAESSGVGQAPSAGPGATSDRSADLSRAGKTSAVPADTAPQTAHVAAADDGKAGSGSTLRAMATTPGPAQAPGAEQATQPAALTPATTSATPPVLAASPAPTPVPTSATPSSVVPLTTQLLTAQLGPRALAAAVAATASGLHTINIQLRPAQLGTIQVVATLGDQGLTLHLHAASDATREVLRSALADLRADLNAGGITDLAGLDVSDRAPDQQSAWDGSSDGRSSPHLGGGPVTTTGASADIPVVPTLLPSRDSRRVDLRV